jgi:hypothetical protein
MVEGLRAIVHDLNGSLPSFGFPSRSTYSTTHSCETFHLQTLEPSSSKILGRTCNKHVQARINLKVGRCGLSRRSHIGRAAPGVELLCSPFCCGFHGAPALHNIILTSPASSAWNADALVNCPCKLPFLCAICLGMRHEVELPGCAHMIKAKALLCEWVHRPTQESEYCEFYFK